MATLGTYLRSGKAFAARLRGSTAAAAGAESGVMVVMGNQACDADTIVSSLLYGFLKSRTEPQQVLSLLPIPRSELKLRRETVHLLTKHAGVDEAALGDVLFEEDVDLAQLHEEGALKLVITDHNDLAQRFAGLAESVVEIVDHHSDMGKLTHVTGDLRNIAFDQEAGSGIGSSCTLVTEKYLKQAPELLESVAAPLLGVILLDTVNLSPKAGKARPQDHAAVDALHKTHPCDLAALFKELQSAKFDPEAWAKLSVLECLGCDYKQFQVPAACGDESKASPDGDDDGGIIEFGASAVLVTLGDWTARHKTWTADVEAFCKERGVTLFMMLTFTIDPTRRQVLVYQVGGHEEVYKRAVAGLRESALEVTEVPISNAASKECVAFEQSNLKASRKQVVPIVYSTFAKL